jgi:peptidoglycan/xylan/chitin deacetylase (PgdA/CDA1 family)
VTAVASLATSEGAPVPGRRVVIQRLGPSVKTLGEGFTDSSGRLSVRFSPTRRAVVRAVFAGDDEYLPSQSVKKTVKPKVLLGKPWTHDAYAYPGQRLPARGTLMPWHPKSSTATTIRAERYEGGKWVLKNRYKAAIVGATVGSRYRSAVRVTSSGRWRIRAEHEDDGHARTLGPATYLTVTDWRARYWGVKNRGFTTSRKVVAITIDDGPNSRTMRICSILEKYGARGTFFFTNQLLERGYEWQARQAYDRGHEIANHTAHHEMLIGSYSFCYAEAKAAISTITDATGFRPAWIRPMGGGISPTGMSAVLDTRQLCVNWSVDSYDSHYQYLPPDTIYHNVFNAVDPGDVILLHQTHPESVEALPRICAELKRRGYKMVTISELAATSRRRY